MLLLLLPCNRPYAQLCIFHQPVPLLSTPTKNPFMSFFIICSGKFLFIDVCIYFLTKLASFFSIKDIQGVLNLITSYKVEKPYFSSFQ